MRTTENVGLPASPQISTTNQLLAMLPTAELQRLVPSLEHVSLARGEVLYEAGQRIRYAYFLNKNTLASVMFAIENGSSIELDVVGSEGLVSIQAFLGPEVYPGRIVVQIAGSAIRIRSDALRAAFKCGGRLQDLLLRYTQAIITQISQTAICNHVHSVEQRLSRWLLTIHDRVEGDIPMTNELISRRLGAHRSCVNEAAGVLRQRGVIRYARGHITILDRAALHSVTCECYEIIKKHHDFPFSQP
jgi:CRP-like cAMP-binding protein